MGKGEMIVKLSDFIGESTDYKGEVLSIYDSAVKIDTAPWLQKFFCSFFCFLICVRQ